MYTDSHNNSSIPFAIMEAISPEKDTIKVLITEKPDEYDPIEQGVDQIILGETDTWGDIIFFYDYSNWIEGEWSLTFTASDMFGNTSTNPYTTYLNVTKPKIDHVFMNQETNTFAVIVDHSKDIEFIKMEAVDSNGDTNKILVTESPKYDVTQQGVDQIISGDFTDNHIIFTYNYSNWAKGDWTLSFTATDKLGHTSNSPLSTQLKITSLTQAEIKNLNIKVFPNPAKDVVNITYNTPTDEKVSVILTNTLGEEITSVQGDLEKASIDVADIKAGLYFTSIVVNGAIISTQKVIIE
ncbi:MAG: T9SS type A sorting domain-containing protein [Cytophagales bacterium]|nr:T9SS type A sorting domain-containing protein [Cytophagales bacterium]